MGVTLRGIAGAVLLVLLSSGCASGSETTAPSSSSTTGLIAEQAEEKDKCSLDGIGRSADDFIGLTESEARAEAETRGYVVIITCRDGVPTEGPFATDLDYHRLNLEIRSGVVASAARA